MSSTLIIFVYHHMGKLKRDKNERLHYVGGQVTEIERVCVDTYNSFLVEGLFMNLGYTSYPECFWLVSGKELSDRLRILRRDVDVAKMCEATEKNENRIELFFEHPVMDNPPIEDDVEVEDDFEVLKEVSDKVVVVDVGGVEVESEAESQTNGQRSQSEPAKCAPKLT
ncbi:hypothetical protein S83_070216 [Arachis hypogaea]|nr:uncharacterized protein DS421_20g693430 [Arachis hypogaea]